MDYSAIFCNFEGLYTHFCMDKRKIDYIKCHGSGNEFVMIGYIGELNATHVEDIPLVELARWACSHDKGLSADGVLVWVGTAQNGEDMDVMRMFNPDGSEAEMCGNGIRCVARAIAEEYGESEFTVWSGGRSYEITRCEDIYPTMPTFGVKIPVRLWSDDFRMPQSAEGRFIDTPIEALHPTLRWSAINVGNPHIIAKVEEVDLELLCNIGERVTHLREIFPNGVNVSFMKVVSPSEIYVATFERGAGLTPSCGTAMTSSATAAVLMGEISAGTTVSVCNRGGKVQCRTTVGEEIVTELIGNATYMSDGSISYDEGEGYTYTVDYEYTDEQQLYTQFTESINH